MIELCQWSIKLCVRIDNYVTLITGDILGNHPVLSTVIANVAVAYYRTLTHKSIKIIT